MPLIVPLLHERSPPSAGAPGGRESRCWSVRRGWGQRGLGVWKEEGEQPRQRPLSPGRPLRQHPGFLERNRPVQTVTIQTIRGGGLLARLQVTRPPRGPQAQTPI